MSPWLTPFSTGGKCLRNANDVTLIRNDSACITAIVRRISRCRSHDLWLYIFSLHDPCRRSGRTHFHSSPLPVTYAGQCLTFISELFSLPFMIFHSAISSWLLRSLGCAGSRTNAPFLPRRNGTCVLHPQFSAQVFHSFRPSRLIA